MLYGFPLFLIPPPDMWHIFKKILLFIYKKVLFFTKNDVYYIGKSKNLLLFTYNPKKGLDFLRGIRYNINMDKTLLKNIATITIGVLDKTDKVFSSVRWITTANLLPHNTLAGYEYGLSYRPSMLLLVQKSDILVRRIAPSYINYIQDIAPNAYIANNVIIIRPKEGQIDPKYLAYYLDKNIEKIIKKAAKGTTLPTLTRQDLEEFEITLPDERTQYLVGNIWYLDAEKIKLQKELRDLESKKLYYILNNRCT